MKKVIIFFIALLLVPMIFAATQEEKREYQKCNADCAENKKLARDICAYEHNQCKLACQNSSCKIVCAKEKNICMRNAANDSSECRKECKKIIRPKCLNGEYAAGEKFEDGCSICKCIINGKISCKKEAFCNKNPEVSEELCTTSGGFYQALCSGPYFDILCSQDKFCICKGINNYSCPINYECLTDFNPPINPSRISRGWTDMLGSSLGKVGVCVN